MKNEFLKQLTSMLLVSLMLFSNVLSAFAENQIGGSPPPTVINPYVATKIDGEHYSIVENTDKVPTAAVTACSIYGRGLTSSPGEKGSDPSLCWVAGSWGDCSNTCGSGEMTRPVVCKDLDGDIVDTCDNSLKMADTRSCEGSSGCVYAWLEQEWGECAPACGTSEKHRFVDCYQNGAIKVENVFCSSLPKPTTVSVCTNYDECGFAPVYGEWSQCSTSCGTGTQTRTAECQREDGVVANLVSCGDVTTTKTCFENTACEYNWQYSEFGSCSNVCGFGTKIRMASCLRSDGSIVLDEMCLGVAELSESCSNYSECSFSWNYGSWTQCSNSCGTGTQARSADCMRSDGTVVGNEQCGAREEISQSCSSISGCTYAWETTTWGACSETCGTGTQTRNAVCKRSDGEVVADSFCTTPRPETSQSCSSVNSCTYSWNYGSWGSCSTTCGTGTQARTATCLRSDGTTVANNFCTETAVLSQSCSSVASCTYSFEYSGWEACSTTCGTGTQVRTAVCKRSDGATMANSYCGTPSLSQSCSSTSGCTFAWESLSWNTCSTTCGAGTQTRTVQCKRSDGTIVADASCVSTKPASSQSCTDTSACTYSWNTTNWGACSTSCGTGTQTRTSTCKRSDGTTVADTYCTTAKPSASQACTSTASCTYSWNYGSWGACSTTCGTGTQSRTATCLRSDGVTVANSFCTATPVLSQGCTNNTNCGHSVFLNFGFTQTATIYLSNSSGAKLSVIGTIPASGLNSITRTESNQYAYYKIVIGAKGSNGYLFNLINAKVDGVNIDASRLTVTGPSVTPFSDTIYYVHLGSYTAGPEYLVRVKIY